MGSICGWRARWNERGTASRRPQQSRSRLRRLPSASRVDPDADQLRVGAGVDVLAGEGRVGPGLADDRGAPELLVALARQPGGDELAELVQDHGLLAGPDQPGLRVPRLGGDAVPVLP